MKLDAQPPFSFSLNQLGDLEIHFSMQGILPIYLQIPAEQVQIIRTCLNQAFDGSILQTLSAKEPPQGGH